MAIKSSFKDTYYVKFYLLAKSGLTDAKIAKAVNVSLKTIEKWKRQKPALREAIEEARSLEDMGAQASFRDYVYQRLDPRLKELWDSINRYEKEKNGILRIEALLNNQGKETRQRLWLYALTNSNFNPSAACRKVNVSRQCFETWCEEPDFQALVDEIDWHKGNFFEAHLVKLVKSGDTHAVIFANRTFNRGRGYGEKLEVQHSGKVEIAYTLDDLDLDVDTLRTLAAAIEKREQNLLEDKSNGRDEKPIEAEFTVKDKPKSKAKRSRHK